MERSRSCVSFDTTVAAQQACSADSASAKHCATRTRRLQRQTASSEPIEPLDGNKSRMRVLPRQLERRLVHQESFDSLSAPELSPLMQRHNHHFSVLMRDNSQSQSQSTESSRYSSVDSLLEARKPDPEAILINLGFGPVGSEDILSRIPKRFLKPSSVRGVDTEAFVKRLQLSNTLADHSVLGYRGLTGNPDIPASKIVAKIMERFEFNERKKSMGAIR